MKKILLITAILSLLSSCASEWGDIEDRTISEEAWNKTMTWIIISLIDWIDWIYDFKESETEKEYEAFSKSFDLWNYLNKEIYVEWIEWNKGLEIFTVREIKNDENKIGAFENEVWWYSFSFDDEKLIATKWWEKSIIKNQSWEIILQIFSFSDQRKTNEPMISNAYKTFWIWWAVWDIKEFDWWFDLWIKTNWNGTWFNLLNLKANYWNNSEETKSLIWQILNTFKLQKKKIIEKINCWWEENITCPNGYYCELFSSSAKSAGKCVPMKVGQ